jgi:predicted ABC-type ATPase
VSDPKILIIAGPNGAGKTTFACDFLPNEAACPCFVNADLIAAGLSPFVPAAAAIKAGKLMLQEIQGNAARREGFAFETTLSGLGYLRHIRDWRSSGYHVTLFFLTLPSIEMAITRVAERVGQGGHDIPEAVIRRRFVTGVRNFYGHYRDAVNAWAVYDNSGDQPMLTHWSEERMTESISNAKNKDLPGSLAAIKRAAQSARELALRTNTAIIVFRDGKIVRVTADELRKAGVRE